ncbi:MAG: hypothetical protein ACJA0P_004425, partial [Planctomycetota bacterium]
PFGDTHHPRPPQSGLTRAIHRGDSLEGGIGHAGGDRIASAGDSGPGICGGDERGVLDWLYPSNAGDAA